MSQTSLKKNAALNMLNSVLSIIFPLITFPYASRILFPEGIGRVNFANSIVSYFCVLATLGISSYAVREAARRREDKRELSIFVKEVFLLNAISTAVSFAALCLTIFFVGKLHGYLLLLAISSSQLLFNLIGLPWLYYAEEEYEYITLRQIFFQIFGLIFLFLFVRTKEDINWYCAMGVLTNVGVNICNFIHSRKYIDWREKAKLNIAQHLKPVFIFFGMTVVTSVYTMLDTSMLGFLSDDTQVGYYTAANKLNKMVFGLFSAAIGVLLPRFAYYREKGKSDEMFALFNKAFGYTLFFAIPAAAGMLAISRPITILMSGQEFAPAVPAMRILTPLLIAISLSSLMGVQLFTPLGKEKFTLYAEILGAAANVTCNCLLIPRYGAIGAACGTIAAESSVTIFELVVGWKYLDKKNAAIFLAQALAAAAVMMAAVYFGASWISNNLLRTLVSVIVGAASYAAASLLLRNKAAWDIIKFARSKIARR